MADKQKVLWDDEKIEYLVKQKEEMLKRVRKRAEEDQKFWNEQFDMLADSFIEFISPTEDETLKGISEKVFDDVFANIAKVKAEGKYNNAPKEVDIWDSGNMESIFNLFYQKRPMDADYVFRYEIDKYKPGEITEDSVSDYLEFRELVKALKLLKNEMDKDSAFSRHEVVDDVLTKTVNSLKKVCEKNKNNPKFTDGKFGTDMMALNESMQAVVGSSKKKAAINDVLMDDSKTEIERISEVENICNDEYTSTGEYCRTFINRYELVPSDYDHIEGHEEFFSALKLLEKIEAKDNKFTDNDKTNLFRALAMVNGAKDGFDRYFNDRPNLTDSEKKLKSCYNNVQKFTDYTFLNLAKVETRLEEGRKSMASIKEKTNYKRLNEEQKIAEGKNVKPEQIVAPVKSASVSNQKEAKKSNLKNPVKEMKVPEKSKSLQGPELTLKKK